MIFRLKHMLVTVGVVAGILLMAFILSDVVPLYPSREYAVSGLLLVTVAILVADRILEEANNEDEY